MRYEAPEIQFGHDIIQLGAIQAQARQQITLNPDAYTAAFLLFQNLLPSTIEPGQSSDVQRAVAWHQAHPEPVASYEYMQAFVNLLNDGKMVYNLSLTAIDHIAPDVAAYSLAQIVGQPHPFH